MLLLMKLIKQFSILLNVFCHRSKYSPQRPILEHSNYVSPFERDIMFPSHIKQHFTYSLVNFFQKYSDVKTLRSIP